MRHRIATAALFVLAACSDPTASLVDAASIDAGPVDAYFPLAPTRQVDLLVVYDGSGATADTGLFAWRAIADIVRGLVTGDLDRDGVHDFAPVESLHFAMTDADLGLDAFAAVVSPPGVGGVGTPCTSDGTGAVFAPVPADLTTCRPDTSAAARRFVAYDASGGAAAADALTSAAECMFPDLSSRHCSYQQPLEAALRALAPAPTADGASPWAFTRDGYAPPVFRGGALGRGDDSATNGGFLRADSVLLVVVVSEHDDCSVPSVAPFESDTTSTVWSAWRCTRLSEAERQPIPRFVDGLVGLRRDPRRFVLALWTGVPDALSDADPDVILADPAMQPENYFSDNPVDFRQACHNTRGFADPAPRLVTFARDARRAGAHASVRGLCTELGDAASATLADVAAALGE